MEPTDSLSVLALAPILMRPLDITEKQTSPLEVSMESLEVVGEDSDTLKSI